MKLRHEVLEARHMLTAVLLKDVNAISSLSSSPRSFAQAGDLAYFVADSEFGTELWRTDGTQHGTRMVDDLVPGPEGSNPLNLSPVGHLLFFEARDRVWRTDGTREGTFAVADAPSSILANTGNRVLLQAMSTESSRSELRIADGSLQNTKKLVFNDIALVPPRKAALIAYNSNFYITQSGSRSPGRGLWVVDEEGNAELLVPGRYDFERFLAAQRHLYFQSSGTLWRTDGTAEGTESSESEIFWSGIVNGTALDENDFATISGTHLWKFSITPQSIASFQPGSIRELTSGGGRLWFVADDGTHGSELWQSDGTAAGTHLVMDIAAGPIGSSPFDLTYHNNALWFVADDGVHGHELWVVDDSGVRLFEDIRTGPESSQLSIIGRLDDDLLLRAETIELGVEPWTLDVDDERSVPTLAPLDLNPGVANSFPSGLAAAGDGYVFAAETNVGVELWTLDEHGGPTLLKDIRRGVATDHGVPAQYVEMRGEFFFSASDGIHGNELWKSDGTAEGTVLVTDILPGPLGASPRQLRVMGDRLYFVAGDQHGRELWTSDGSAAGTKLVLDLFDGNLSSSPYDLATVEDALYFTANNGLRVGSDFQRSIWRTDGTEAGTTIVHTPSTERRVVEISSLTGFHDSLYFLEMTRSVVLRQLNASTGDVETYPETRLGVLSELEVVGDHFFFRDQDGIRATASEIENATLILGGLASGEETAWVSSGKHLFIHWRGRSYVTDGTSPAEQIHDFVIDLESQTSDPVLEAVESNGSVFLIVGEEFGAHRELWVWSGAAGEPFVKLERFESQALTALPRSLTPHATGVYFVAGDGNTLGSQIWSSDGTSDGTVAVTSIGNDSVDPRPDSLLPIDDNLYFSANDGVHGIELWKLDSRRATGDFNGDTFVDATDIDLLFAAIRDQESNPSFDLDQDQMVDDRDVDFLVEQMLNTRRGDIDLDGAVAFADFIRFANSFGKANPGWAQGDFNGDGLTDFADFLLLVKNFGFTRS